MLRRFVNVRPEETRALLLATLYGFCIFLAYYILRPVRDEISSADRGNLQLIWTAVFFVMLMAVPAYSWLTTKFERRRFVPITNRFFLSNLVLFYLALVFLPEEARPWIDRVFYVWASVFALFVVTVYWGFLADLFSQEQGKRLFPVIAVGASIGAIAGSIVATLLADAVPTFALLLVAAVPLEIASLCVLALSGDAAGKSETNRDAALPLPGDALSGIRMVFQSRYLMMIVAFVATMTFASTVLYFLQADLLAEAFTDRGARTGVYAKIDLAVNVLTILFQVLLTARILRWFGVAAALALLPGLTFLGFATLGLVPTLTALILLQVAYRTVRYGITKPAREVLFTVLNREEKYKSKAFLDAAVYRGGDLVSGWIYTGLAALGLTVGAIALVAAPVMIVWLGIAVVLGRKHEHIATAPQETMANQ